MEVNSIAEGPQSHEMQVGMSHKTWCQWHGSLLQIKVGGNGVFISVAKFNTIRCIFALRVAMDLGLYEKDMKTTFLSGKSEADIYMEQ